MGGKWKQYLDDPVSCLNTCPHSSPIWQTERRGGIEATEGEKEIKQMHKWRQNIMVKRKMCDSRGAIVYIFAPWIHHTALTDPMLQSDYLSAILKDHNSGYITRKTCFTAPPQTKGFRHETGYYEIQLCPYSQQHTAGVFCKLKDSFWFCILGLQFHVSVDFSPART